MTLSRPELDNYCSESNIRLEQQKVLKADKIYKRQKHETALKYS